MDLQDIISKIDIAEYIGRYVELEQRGEELWGISPFTYPPECTPSFSVRPATGQFYDFSSHIGGNLFTFIKHYHKTDAKNAVRIMKEYLGIDPSSEISSTRIEKIAGTDVCKRFLKKNTIEKQANAIILKPDQMDRYEINRDKLEIWRKEGISDEAMRFFDVRYDGFSNRIVYPIKDINGNIVNIGGRTLDPEYKEKKLRKYTYFNGWGGRLGVVYGLYENMADIREAKRVILFEGVKSVMIARGFGYRNCGAILTSHLNPYQAKLLAALGVTCVFAFDKEIFAGDDRNVQFLKKYVRVEYIYDSKNLLDDKQAPVDKGKDVFDTLYSDRRRLW